MSYTSNYDVSPKSIMSSSSNESLSQSVEDTTWSPFSTPFFCNNNNLNASSSSFQYSSRYYPAQSVSLANSNRVNQPHQINGTSAKSMPKRSEQIDLKDLIRRSEAQRMMGGRSKLCTFCKTNGESEAIYTSHALKDYTDRITCPILLKYSCPICGATGAKVHTKKYCPVLQRRLRLDLINNITSSQN